MARAKRRQHPAGDAGKDGDWRTVEYTRAYDGLIRRMDEVVAAGFDTGERVRLITMGEKAAAFGGDAPESLYDALIQLRIKGALGKDNLDDVGGRLAVIPGTPSPQRMTIRVAVMAAAAKFDLTGENAEQVCVFLHDVTPTAKPSVTEEALDKFIDLTRKEGYNPQSFGSLLKVGTEAVRQGLNAHSVLGIYNSIDKMLYNQVITPENAGEEGRKLFAVAHAATEHFKDRGEATEDILSQIGSLKPRGDKTTVEDIVAQAIKDIRSNTYRKRF